MLGCSGFLNTVLNIQNISSLMQSPTTAGNKKVINKQLEDLVRAAAMNVFTP
jgi:hypothetical protein